MQDEINQVVDKYIALLPVEDDKLLAHSEVKASKFLLAVAKLADIRGKLLNSKVKKDALKSVAYADAINNAVGSNAPIREANAAANPNYLGVSEDVSIIDNQLKYTNTMIEVFNNAHILYRGLMKGEI